MKVNYVAILLFQNDKLFLVQNYQGQWMAPCGKVSKGVKPEVALEKCFLKQTGYELDIYKINQMGSFMMDGAMIFVAYTTRSILFNPNDEAIYADTFDMNNLCNLEKYTFESIKMAVEKKFIPITSLGVEIETNHGCVKVDNLLEPGFHPEIKKTRVCVDHSNQIEIKKTKFKISKYQARLSME